MPRFVTAFGMAAIGLIACNLRLNPVSAQDDAARPEFFTTRVQPILQNNCARCHGSMNHRGGLSLDTRDSMLKGGHHGPALVPGDPANSRLLTLIRHEGPSEDPMNMPPNRPKLSDADIATVEQWIKAGAVTPKP